MSIDRVCISFVAVHVRKVIRLLAIGLAAATLAGALLVSLSRSGEVRA